MEFALLAPVLAFALLASVDLGLALSERMAIDHALRAGAQSAMADPGEATVADVMRTTAETNFSLADPDLGAADDSLGLSVTRFCACPDAVSYAVTCSTICAGSRPTYIYYRLRAEKRFSGWIAPDIDFERTEQVQIR